MPYQYSLGNQLESFGGSGGSGTGGFPGPGPGPGVGGTGGAGMFGIPSYDPTVPSWARRQMGAPGIFGANPMGMGQEMSGANSIMRGGARATTQSPTGFIPGPAPTTPSFGAPPGQGSNPGQYGGGPWGNYNPTEGGKLNAHQIMAQIMQRLMGAGVMDPTGQTNALLPALQEKGYRDLGAGHQAMLTNAQLRGMDPSQIASYSMQNQMQQQGHMGRMLSDAQTQLGMNAQSGMMQALMALLGAEGVQHVGKYDMGRMGQGGLDFGGLASGLGTAAGAYFGSKGKK